MYYSTQGSIPYVHHVTPDIWSVRWCAILLYVMVMQLSPFAGSPIHREANGILFVSTDVDSEILASIGSLIVGITEGNSWALGTHPSTCPHVLHPRNSPLPLWLHQSSLHLFSVLCPFLRIAISFCPLPLLQKKKNCLDGAFSWFSSSTYFFFRFSNFTSCVMLKTFLPYYLKLFRPRYVYVISSFFHFHFRTSLHEARYRGDRGAEVGIFFCWSATDSV